LNAKFDWRGRTKAALEAYFARRSYPRVMLTLLVIITGVAAFFVSYALLHLGVNHMCARYPIAVLGGYGVLLALVRGWVELERANFDPAGLRIDEAGASESTSPVYRDSGRLRWWDWLDVPDLGDVDSAESCIVALLIAVVLGAILAASFAVVVAVFSAPALIAEVFLDVFIVSVLYRRLRMAQKEHWLGTALRRTWVPAVVTAAALFTIGWILEQLAPGAHSIGQALEQLRG
jgi:hypothetical protein